MNLIRVQYTVQSDYVETNRKNIEKVMADLKELNNPNIKYSSFLLEDGKTFMHLALYSDAETGSIVQGLDSFKNFQEQLKASEPESPPQAEELELVASAYDLFPNS